MPQLQGIAYIARSNINLLNSWRVNINSLCRPISSWKWRPLPWSCNIHGFVKRKKGKWSTVFLIRALKLSCKTTKCILSARMSNADCVRAIVSLCLQIAILWQLHYVYCLVFRVRKRVIILGNYPPPPDARKSHLRASRIKIFLGEFPKSLAEATHAWRSLNRSSANWPANLALEGEAKLIWK